MLFDTGHPHFSIAVLEAGIGQWLSPGVLGIGQPFHSHGGEARHGPGTDLLRRDWWPLQGHFEDKQESHLCCICHSNLSLLEASITTMLQQPRCSAAGRLGMRP